MNYDCKKQIFQFDSKVEGKCYKRKFTHRCRGFTDESGDLLAKHMRKQAESNIVIKMQ